MPASLAHRADHVDSKGAGDSWVPHVLRYMAAELVEAQHHHVCACVADVFCDVDPADALLAS